MGRGGWKWGMKDARILLSSSSRGRNMREGRDPPPPPNVDARVTLPWAQPAAGSVHGVKALHQCRATTQSRKESLFYVLGPEKHNGRT